MYTHLPSHSCAHPYTHTWAYRPMVTHACASPRCPHTLTHRKSHVESRETRPDPYPATPSHTHGHLPNTHTQLKNIDPQRSTLGLARGQPPRDTMHTEKNAQGATRVHTPGWTHTQTHGHTHTKSQPPALTPPRSPNRRQALALTPGRTVQTQAAVLSSQPRPGSQAHSKGLSSSTTSK